VLQHEQSDIQYDGRIVTLFIYIGRGKTADGSEGGCLAFLVHGAEGGKKLGLGRIYSILIDCDAGIAIQKKQKGINRQRHPGSNFVKRFE